MSTDPIDGSGGDGVRVLRRRQAVTRSGRGYRQPLRLPIAAAADEAYRATKSRSRTERV